MKYIILIILLSVLNLKSFDFKIKFIESDGNEKEYSVEEIKNLKLDLESETTLIIEYNGGSSEEILLSNEDEFTFNEHYFIINNDEEKTFSMFDIAQMTFEEMETSNKIEWGELEVDEIIVDGLSNPWGLDFLNENEIIFTEHSGSLHIYNIETKQKTNVSGIPSNFTQNGQGGLLDVTIHPNYNTNKYVYIAYTIRQGNGFTTAIGRGKLENNQLNDYEEIFRGSPMINSGQHFGCRIIFDKDNFLYFPIGDRGTMANAQDSTNYYGKVMKIYDDGRVPDDNPFVNAPNAKPELYTMGNRNIQGMFYLSEKDEIWAIEHGPRGGDELNIIKKGANYAWPLATYGINYDGTPITEKTSLPGYEDPITYWVPSIAPCGMDLVSYNAEKDEIDLVFGNLAGQHIHRLLIRNNKVVDSVRSLNGYGRFRDIQLSPDGSLYTAVQSPGRILKLKVKK